MPITRKDLGRETVDGIKRGEFSRAYVGTQLDEARLVFVVDGELRELIIDRDFELLLFTQRSAQPPGVYEVALTDAD